MVYLLQTERAYCNTKMESVNTVSNLLEVGCGDECKKTFKKQKIKFILFYVISTAVMSLLCVNTILLEEMEREDKLKVCGCNTLNGTNLTFNAPKCLYVDKYPLTNEVYLRVCQSHTTTTIDIRHFSEGKWTLNGIQISKMQWQYLKKSINHIDSSLLQTETLHDLTHN